MGFFSKIARKAKRAIKSFGRNVQRIVDDVTDKEWWSYLEDEVKDAYRSMMEHVLKAVSYTHLTLPTNREV